MTVIGLSVFVSRRKCRMNPYCYLIILLTLLSIYILGRRLYDGFLFESFEDFSYPSEYNFHELLHHNNASSISKLNPYRPLLVNNIRIKNSNITSVIIIVKSAIGHGDNRARIRATWGSRRCQRSNNMTVYFALGSSDNIALDDVIESESQLYDDILRFNFVDTYYNNTYKVMAIMDHFTVYHSSVPYLLIIDDDFFLNPSLLRDTITRRISRFQYERYLGGYVYFHNMPQRSRSSKWYVSRQDYTYDFYPPYPTGGFLLISNPMVAVCNKLLPYLKYSPMDDVLLGILLFKLNIYPSHLRSVSTFGDQTLSGELLAFHSDNADLVEYWRSRNYSMMC